MRHVVLLLAVVATVVILSPAPCANAAVMDMGCWNCRYSWQEMWPLAIVTAECVSAADGGTGMGIQCRTAWTNSFIGINTVQDCEFSGGECMYIEVHGRVQRHSRTATAAKPAPKPKNYCF